VLSERGFGILLDAVYCPICGGKLHVDKADGKRRLLCDRHGAMRVYLELDSVAPEVKRVCDVVGVEDLEAP